MIATIEYRQPRQFDGQIVAAVDRPIQRDTAPGVVGGKGLEHAAVGIYPEGLRNLVPCPAERRHRVGPDQIAELLAVERKAAVAVHPPYEAQGQPAWMLRKLLEPRRRYRR